MKILIPVAAYHEYNTAIYVEKAFRALGHEARVITQADFYACVVDDPADLYFGVDSAGPLDFPLPLCHKTVMWFIDSRHNNNPTRRSPDDDTNAKKLADNRGWVFQAQKRDWTRGLYQHGIVRGCWLPLAADPDTWAEWGDGTKLHDVGFGGNIWCNERRLLLDKIAAAHNLSHVTGTPVDLARNYCHSRLGFNVSGWFGSGIDYDVNMRVFEVMSCGVPLVTNQLAELQELGMAEGTHYVGFRTVEEALKSVQLVLIKTENYRRTMGERARALILAEHTYERRMEEALEVLQEAGVIEQ